MSMPRYAAASANDAPYTGPTLMIGDISSQQREERLKDEQARESAEKKENLYATLEIEKTDSQEEIKKAYRKMALKNHPDRGGNAETFKQIGKAYRILSNERAKKVYDDTYKPGIFA
jgi:preprotein translocase subunit Sec63